jgi:hypothetical protein
MAPTQDEAQVLRADVGGDSCKLVFNGDFLRIESHQGVRSTTEVPMRQILWAETAQDLVTLHFLSPNRGGLQLQSVAARVGKDDQRTTSWVDGLLDAAYKGASGESCLPVAVFEMLSAIAGVQRRRRLRVLVNPVSGKVRYALACTPMGLSRIFQGKSFIAFKEIVAPILKAARCELEITCAYDCGTISSRLV